MNDAPRLRFIRVASVAVIGLAAFLSACSSTSADATVRLATGHAHFDGETLTLPEGTIVSVAVSVTETTHRLVRRDERREIDVSRLTGSSDDGAVAFILYHEGDRFAVVGSGEGTTHLRLRWGLETYATIPVVVIGLSDDE